MFRRSENLAVLDHQFWFNNARITHPLGNGTSRIGYLVAVQVVAVGGFRPETIETYRRVPGHVLRNLSGAVLACPGLPIGTKNHFRMPDLLER